MIVVFYWFERKGKRMGRLSALDASFVYYETARAPMHIGGADLYDPSSAPNGRVTFTGILEHIESRLHLVKSFRQKLVRVPGGIDHPYWVDDEQFDLEFHVRHIALPKPGDWRQLCIQVARLHSRSIDLNRPPWEIYVIDALDHVEGYPPGTFALVHKNHHASIDGASGMEMISAIHDPTPEPTPREPVARESERAPSSLEMVGRGVLNNLSSPVGLLEQFARRIPRLPRDLTRGTATFPKPAPRTRFNGSVTPHRAFEARRFDLDRIRDVRASVPGSTVNDVVLAAAGGALRRYLNAKNELPGTALQALVPVSTRTAADREAGGNQVTSIFVPLATHMADPLERLEAVRAETSAAKAALETTSALELSAYSQMIPGGLAALGARAYSKLAMHRVWRPFVNCSVTNVPGPRDPLYLCGARLLDMYATGPIYDGLGLILIVNSYCGRMTMSVTSCREMLPDPGFFAECLAEAVDELAMASRITGISPAGAARGSTRSASRRGGERQPKH